jgi:hypothetical protein
MLAVPITEIVTGLLPDVLQLVPEVPVCPDEEIVRFCAFTPVVISKNERTVKLSQFDVFFM